MSTTFLLRLLAVLVALALITSGILVSFVAGQKILGLLLVPLGIFSLIVTGKVQFRRISNND